MNRKHDQAGFGHIAMVLVVLVFGAIGAIGYTLYAHPSRPGSGNPGQGQTQRQDPRTTETTLNVPAAPEIKSASDLDTALTTLESVDPGSASQSDTTQLDSQLGGF